MARLPHPGGDNDQWGDLLNAYLRVSHNEDGTEKEGAPLILPINLGPDIFNVSENGAVAISPVDPDTGLTVKSSNDGAPTIRTMDSSGTMVAAIEPSGIYAEPTVHDGVGLFIQGSHLDGSGLLMDLENGRTVFEVTTSGATLINPIGDNSALVLRPTEDLISPLQVWQNSNNDNVSWIEADGTPGGALKVLPAGWNVNNATGELGAFNPNDSSGVYNTITFVRPTDYASWNAIQLLDDVGNYLGGFNGTQVESATPDQAVARLSATEGISYNNASGFNLFNVNASGRMVLGDGEVLGALRFQNAQGDSSLYVQGPGEAVNDIFQVANRTGSGEEDVHIIFSVDPYGATSIFANGSDVVPLVLHGSGSGATSNLQEWRDGDANLVAWVGPDGTPGGTLAGGGGSSSGLPVGDLAMFTLDTSTYPNAFDDGSYQTAVFSNPAPVFVVAQDGDAYPRLLLNSDAARGLYLGDGTVDILAHGANIWSYGVPDGFTSADLNLAGAGNMLSFGVVDPADATNPTITSWGDFQLTDLQQTVGVVFRARLGNPNGNFAGRQGDIVFDGQTPAIWQCTTTGDANSVVWTQIGTGGSGNVPDWVQFYDFNDSRMEFVGSADNQSAAILATMPSEQAEGISGGMLQLANFQGEAFSSYVALDSNPDLSSSEFGIPRFAYLTIFPHSEGTEQATVFIGDPMTDGDFVVYGGGATYIAPSDDSQTGYGFLVGLEADMSGIVVRASENQTADLQTWIGNDNTPLAWIAADGTPGGTLAGGAAAGPFAATQAVVGNNDSFNATANYMYVIDASSGGVTVNLPEEPPVGTAVGVVLTTDSEYAISASTTDGAAINGMVGYGISRKRFSSVVFVYAGATEGWSVLVTNDRLTPGNVTNSGQRYANAWEHVLVDASSESVEIVLPAYVPTGTQIAVEVVATGNPVSVSHSSPDHFGDTDDSNFTLSARGETRLFIYNRNTTTWYTLSHSGATGGDSGLPTGWTADSNAGQLTTVNPSDGDANYTVLTFAKPDQANSWTAFRAVDSNNNDLGSFDSNGFTSTGPSKGAAVLSADAITLTDANSFLLLSVAPGSGTYMQAPSGVTLTLFAAQGQTDNLQEWKDENGNVQAWIAPDGTAGGTLASGGGGTTQTVASIDGQVAIGSPADITYQLTQAFPIDGVNNAYGNYANTWSSHTYPFAAGMVFTVSPFTISGIDSRVSDYTFTVSIGITPASTPTNTMWLIADVTLAGGVANDSAALNVGDFQVLGVTDGNLNYDNGTGELTVVTDTDLYFDVQVSGTWGNLVNGG